MSQVPTLTGQDIGQAEKATRALLDALLAETATPFNHWVALRLLATSGGSADTDHVVAQMVHGLKITPDDVRKTLADLETGNMIAAKDADTARVELTPAGGARFEQINAGVQRIAALLYGDLPVDDLVVARRVLATVTERANAELAVRSQA